MKPAADLIIAKRGRRIDVFVFPLNSAQDEIAELRRSRDAWRSIGTHAIVLFWASWLFFVVIQLLQAYVW